MGPGAVRGGGSLPGFCEDSQDPVGGRGGLAEHMRLFLFLFIWKKSIFLVV